MLPEQKKIRIIGVPLDLGAGHRGVDMGPSAIRVARLMNRIKSLGHSVYDWGDIPTEVFESVSTGDNSNMKHAAPVAAVNKKLAALVNDTLTAGEFPLVIGGDHSLAIGSIAGSAAYLKNKSPSFENSNANNPQINNKDLGLIWIDAHADMNTPATTPSGNIHGMSLAVSIGKGDTEFVNILFPGQKVKPENIVLVGVRDLDPAEQQVLQELGITTFTMRDIDEIGMYAVMNEAIHITSRDTAGIHIEFDMDSIDPNIAPGTGTPVPGGLTYREAHLAMELLHDTQKVIALDIVETNPALDIKNQTAELAAQLIMSLLGKSIN